MKKKQFEPPRVVEWLCLSFESPVLAGSDQENEAGGGNRLDGALAPYCLENRPFGGRLAKQKVVIEQARFVNNAADGLVYLRGAVKAATARPYTVEDCLNIPGYSLESSVKMRKCGRVEMAATFSEEPHCKV